MSVVTRLDGRSKVNNSIQVFDKSGALLATIEALDTEVRLRIATSDDIKIVKSNGAVLKRKK